MAAPWASAGPSERVLHPGARLAAALVLGLLLASGCRTAPAAPDSRDPQPAAATPRIRPLGGGQGTVVQVQPALRFVVVDFSLNTLPAPDQVLKVYRNGQVVAEVKAGRIGRDTNLAADIVSGEPMTGDIVRPE